MPEWEFQNDRLCIDYGNGPIDYCEAVGITEVRTDIISGEKEVDISVFADTGEASVTIPRSKLSLDVFPALWGLGLTMPDDKDDKALVLKVLFETEADAEKYFVHHKLGFIQDNEKNRFDGKFVFLGDKAIGTDKASFFYDSLKIKSKGSFKAWREGIKIFIDKRPSLQLALILGATSPVAALLSRYNVFDGTAVFSLVGASSTGKSSSLKLGASPWGLPAINTGVIDDFRTTKNFFFESLGRKDGFYFGYDESSAQPSWDFTDVVYDIQAGTEKGRCFPDGSPRPRNTWSGSVIITGEKSLFEQTNKNKGLFARLVELTIPWTIDAKEAEDIVSFATSQYGTAYVPLVQKLLETPKNELTSLFFDSLELVISIIKPQSGVERRISRFYALILATAQIASEAWDMEFDYEAILELLKNNHQRNVNLCDPGELLYERLVEQVLSNNGRFQPRIGSADVVPSPCWGMFDTYGSMNMPCVWITMDRFSKMVETAGEPNISLAKNLLHEKGYLRKFGDRFVQIQKIGDVRAKMYCLALGIPSEYKGQEPKKENPKRHTIKSNMANLLGDDDED